MTKPIECDAALSDLVLQAARAAMPADLANYYADHGAWLNRAGRKQAPLLALLGALLDATTSVAAAIADNASDDCRPLPAGTATALADDSLAIRAHLISASQCPIEPSFELPSFTEASALELA